jgi:hypothetical protein
MRGIDHQQSQMFSYLSPETRVRKAPLPPDVWAAFLLHHAKVVAR